MGSPVASDAGAGEHIELYYAFPLDQERESLALIRSMVVYSGTALTLIVVSALLPLAWFKYRKWW